MAEQTFGVALWLWLLVAPLILVVIDSMRTRPRADHR